MVQELMEALSKLPVFKGVVYRAVDVPLAPSDYLSQHYDYGFVNDFIKQWQPGSVVHDSAFVSASNLKTGAGDARNSVLQLQIKSKTGRNIQKYSHEPEEKEVLFPAGTNFRIISIQGGLAAPTKHVGSGGARWNKNFFTYYYENFFQPFDKRLTSAKISRGTLVPFILVQVEEI